MVEQTACKVRRQRDDARAEIAMLRAELDGPRWVERVGCGQAWLCVGEVAVARLLFDPEASYEGHWDWDIGDGKFTAAPDFETAKSAAMKAFLASREVKL